MPAALIPIAIAAGGAALSATGKSGKQGGVTQTGTSTDTIDRTTTSNQAGQQQQTLDPTAMKFLQQLFPQIQQAIGQAQQPLYGEAQKAGYLGDLDRLMKGSIQNLQQNLARSGASNSGRMSQGLTDLNMNRNTQASNFFSQIPMLNQQARMQALPSLFGSMQGAISQAPRGQTWNQTGTQHQTGTDIQTSQQQQSKQGAPWWKNFLTGFGGALGGGGGSGGGGFTPGSWMDRNVGELGPV